MAETCGPGTCTAGHGFRAATPRPANPKVPALLPALRPNRGFPAQISLDLLEHIVQQFMLRLKLRLAHVSTKLMGHKFEPQFCSSKLDQEHFSSNAGPCKLIGCNCDGSWPKFPANKRITNVKKNHEPPTFI